MPLVDTQRAPAAALAWYQGAVRRLARLIRGAKQRDLRQALVFCSQALRAGRAYARARAGDYVRAAAEADRVADAPPPVPGEAYFQAARCLSQCAAGVEKESNLSPEERRRRAEVYAARAVVLLGRARAAGLAVFANEGKTEKLKGAVEFKPLWSRPDFKRLTAGWSPTNGSAGPGPKPN
jgi:hypothetical protein